VAYLCYPNVCYRNLFKQGRQLLHETPYCFRHFKRCKQNGVPECQTVCCICKIPRIQKNWLSDTKETVREQFKWCFFSITRMMKGNLPSADGNKCSAGDCSKSHYSEGYKVAMNLINVATLAVLDFGHTVCKCNCHLRSTMKKRCYNT
jgi:hypothetical protein